MELNFDLLTKRLRAEREKKAQRLEVFLLTLDKAKAKEDSTSESRDKDIWSLTGPTILGRGPSHRETKGGSLGALEKALEDLGRAAKESGGEDHEHFLVVHERSRDERSRDKDIWSLNGSLPPSSLAEMPVPDVNPPQGEQCGAQARAVTSSAIIH